MDVYEAIKERRSIRKYKDKKVPESVLEKCVNSARLSPSGANIQPLKFITITEDLGKVFECTNWAGYLDWEPSKEEMPRAYVAITKHMDKGLEQDVGIAAQSICLTAENEGLGSCMLGAIDKEPLEDMLPIPNEHRLELMIALGYPDEEPEMVESDEDIEYYYEDGKLKVPKRRLEDVWIRR